MKKSKIILSVSFIFAILFSFQAVAQEEINTNELNQEWQLVKEQDGMKIYSQLVECPYEGMKPTKFAFLKIENTNQVERSIQFNFGLQFTEVCSGCDENSEFGVNLTIPSNSTVEGNCSDSYFLARIVRNLNNPVAGRNFEHVNINNLNVD